MGWNISGPVLRIVSVAGGEYKILWPRDQPGLARAFLFPVLKAGKVMDRVPNISLTCGVARPDLVIRLGDCWVSVVSAPVELEPEGRELQAALADVEQSTSLPVS